MFGDERTGLRRIDKNFLSEFEAIPRCSQRGTLSTLGAFSPNRSAAVYFGEIRYI